MRVLVEPKNAVTRQFQKFLQLDKVELVFTAGALRAAAEVALDRKTGARALRSIVEEALLEVMFDIPERTDVRKLHHHRGDDPGSSPAAAADEERRRQGRRRDELRGVARRARRERLGSTAAGPVPASVARSAAASAVDVSGPAAGSAAPRAARRRE